MRQGGILSPLLFNVFIEDLSILLSNLKIGCYLNNVCFNHLNYADDSIVLAPSPVALQNLIDVCVSYAKQNDMIYNVKKCYCMVFMPKHFKKIQTPTLSIGTQSLKWVTDHKYLGVILNKDLLDHSDMNRQTKSFYARGNILIKHFKQCSEEVKVQLFKTYCCNMYAGHLWNNYNKDMFKRCQVAYNNIYRSLFNVKRGDSISAAFVRNNILGFRELLRKFVNSFHERILSSENNLVKTSELCVLYV